VNGLSAIGSCGLELLFFIPLRSVSADRHLFAFMMPVSSSSIARLEGKGFREPWGGRLDLLAW